VGKPKTTTIHVVWAPNVGPMVAYYDPTKAWATAKSILGVDVIQIELREDLPDVVEDDLESEAFGDDDTPLSTARAKTTKMPPLQVEGLAELTSPRTVTPPKGLVEPPPEQPNTPRTRSRVVMPPITRPPSPVEIDVGAIDDKDRSDDPER
jgi:hypothetical protein